MKFKIAAMFLSAACIAAPLRAESAQSKKVSIGLWGGYNTVAMNDVNSFMKNLGAGGSVTETKDATMLGADFLFEAAPDLFIGPRIEYMFVSSGKVSVGSPLFKMSQDLYVLPVMAGGRYTFYKTDDWNLSCSLFLGVGIGYGQSKVTTAAAPSSQTVTRYSGSSLTELIMAGWQYKIGRDTYLGIDAGYRQLNIPSMNIDNTSESSASNSGNSGYGYSPSRAPVKNASGGDLGYDFSGMVLNVGVNFMF